MPNGDYYTDCLFIARASDGSVLATFQDNDEDDEFDEFDGIVKWDATGQFVVSSAVVENGFLSDIVCVTKIGNRDGQQQRARATNANAHRVGRARTAVQASVSVKPLRCEHESTTLTVEAQGDAPFRYALDDGPFVRQNVFSDVRAGQHSVRVRSATGSTVTVSVTVAAPSAAPVLTLAVGNVGPVQARERRAAWQVARR